LAEQKKCLLKELTLDDLKNIEPKITNDIYAVLEPSKSISSRRSYGGTAPQNVKTAISVARQRFLES
jgi:argininosuccinate lyase